MRGWCRAVACVAPAGTGRGCERGWCRAAAWGVPAGPGRFTDGSAVGRGENKLAGQCAKPLCCCPFGALYWQAHWVWCGSYMKVSSRQYRRYWSLWYCSRDWGKETRAGGGALHVENLYRRAEGVISRLAARLARQSRKRHRATGIDRIVSVWPCIQRKKGLPNLRGHTRQTVCAGPGSRVVGHLLPHRPWHALTVVSRQVQARIGGVPVQVLPHVLLPDGSPSRAKHVCTNKH